MSLPIDNSTQLPQSTFTSGTPNYNDVNEWSKLENIIYNTSLNSVGIGTTNPNGFKLNVLGTLKASSFYGDGANITNVPYSTITGKPTNFQADFNSTIINKPSYYPADWNTTIANKPSIYTQSEITSLLNAKEAVLTFNSPLTRTTNNIGINLNSYTPFSALNSCNYLTNASGDAKYTLSNFTPSFTQLNSCNYLTNASGDAKYTLSNFTPSFTQLNSCNYLTNASADAKYTQSNFTPSFNQLNSCNYINNSTSSLTNYTRTGLDNAYLLKTGGTMTGEITNNSSTASTFNYLNLNHASTGRLSHFPFGDNKIYLRAPIIIDFDTLSFGSRVQDFLIYLYGADYGIGINSGVLRFNCHSSASHKFYSGTTNTATIGNNGIITASGFSGSGSGLTNIPYSSLTGTTPFYTKGEADTLLNAKEAVLSFNSPLTRTTNTIGINLNSYVPFSALSQSNYATYTGLLSSNFTSNSTISLTNYTRTGLDNSYLLKTGGTLIGDFNIEKANPILSIKSSAETQSSIFYLSTPLNITSGLKTAIIAQGLSAWGRSKLHFCLNDNQTDNSTAQNASISHSRMTILPTGNIGIGNVSPVLNLDIGSTNANHNIGRAILTTDALNIHAPDKRDFLSIGRWDGSSTTDMQFSGIKYGVITGAQSGESANNHSCITFHTWGNSVWNSKEVARITSRGRLGLNTSAPTELLDVNGNIKSSGNLLVSGNVGIGTISMSSKVHIEHSSTSFNGMNGGFYLYNPNNTANSSSCIGARIGGSTANRAGLSLDVAGNYGWSMYINGYDTSEKWLRFNSSWDGTGSERLQIRGSDGYTNINGGLYIADYTTIRNIVNDRSSYNHALAPLTITNQTISGTTLNDSLPVLNICRQGLGGVAYGQRATMCLSRFANDNVWSRTRLDFKLASDTYNDVFAMTLRSDGNTYFYPNPQNINNTNGANYAVNLNVACFTTGYATAPFITCIVNDGWNGIDTSTIITAQSGANSGYNNASRIYLDASYATNAGFGSLASYISFQSKNSGGGWNTNAYLRTTNTSITFRVDGNISCFSLTQTSTSNIKTDIQPIENALNIITQLEGHYYKNIKTDNYDYGLIAEEVENVLPDIVDKTNEDLIGISYTSLIPILIEGVKEMALELAEAKNKINQMELEIRQIRELFNQ
jgi:hypothetical protein